MLTMTGYYLLFGLPIVHPKVKTAYGKSAEGFWIVMILGVVGLVVDVYTNYVIFYTITAQFVEFEPFRFVIGMTGSLLMGLADVFLFGTLRSLRQKDTMIIYMILGSLYLGLVSLYDVSFTDRALREWFPIEISLTVSIVTTVLEVFFFQALEDLRTVRMVWQVQQDPQKDVEPKFWGRRVFGEGITTVYQTLEEFKYYFWGGIVAFGYRYVIIMITLAMYVADKDANVLAALFAVVFFGLLFTMSDFLLTRFLERAFRHELARYYMVAGVVVSAIMSLLALLWGAQPAPIGEKTYEMAECACPA